MRSNLVPNLNESSAHEIQKKIDRMKELNDMIKVSDELRQESMANQNRNHGLVPEAPVVAPLRTIAFAHLQDQHHSFKGLRSVLMLQ